MAHHVARITRRRWRTFLLLISTISALIIGPSVPALAQSVPYQPPVPGAVVDGWRAPTGPYGAGNRGIDYATTVGEAVSAPAAGVVTFAGSVAGTRWVVIRHADGRRSSLGPLGPGALPTGTVAARQVVGVAAGTAVHWGVREADVYIDPGSLLPVPDGGRGRLRLTA